ncbi:ABC transporter permease [Nesterenkonia flava]|uniref:ABC transporter permease subunit n=1 Tax=Nesterenkonia flava TaxID=469799 RepID=A0ABU1FV15_9MICC|nr:ABC transporter permease subunit [Nesterenkonia flava]MDR5712512.1 ABC transporter permease subunit [Nesterenkonia flava]
MSTTVPGTPAPPETKTRGATGWLSWLGINILHLWPLALVLIAWDLWVVINDYSALIAPRPWAAISDVITQPDQYASDTLFTALMSLGGLVVGTAVGTVCAILVWWSAALSGVVTPAALILRSVPISALIPIIARLVGYDDKAVFVSIVVITFFPSFVFVLSGLSSIPAAGRDLFAVMGAGKPQLLLRLGLLHSVPNLMISVRITAPIAVMAAILTEFLIGQNGLGALFAEARSYRQWDLAWGTAVIATVLSVAIFLSARWLERRVTDRVT